MVALYALLGGILGAFYFFTRRPPDGNFWGAVYIGEGLFLLQVVLGLLLWAFGTEWPTRLDLHILYGLSSILTLPLVYTFMRNRSSGTVVIAFTIAFFFIWGLAQRAVETAVH